MSNRKQNVLILVACGLVCVAIDGLDYATGRESDLFVFYFVPVALAAWRAGRGAGILMALIAAVAWFESDFLSEPSYLWVVGSWDTAMRLTAFLGTALATWKIREELAREQALNRALATAMAEVKQLRGIIPMCSFCRKIRDDKNQWIPLESYISKHSDAQVSHGLCPACYKKHYGEENGT